MRTRQKWFADYGFAPGEADKLKAGCQKPDFSEEFLLLESAKMANESIFYDIFFSIVRGVSYEKMDAKVYQNIDKGSFYGYQRKTLAIFREGLIEVGRYPFATC